MKEHTTITTIHLNEECLAKLQAVAARLWKVQQRVGRPQYTETIRWLIRNAYETMTEDDKEKKESKTRND